MFRLGNVNAPTTDNVDRRGPRLRLRFQQIDFGLQLREPFELKIDIPASPRQFVLQLRNQRAESTVLPSLARERGFELDDSRRRHGEREDIPDQTRTQ